LNIWGEYLNDISDDRWGNSVLGFIATVLIPVPFLLYRYVWKCAC